MISQSFAYFVCQVFKYGCVLLQLIQEYVQKSINTTFPRSHWSVSGSELIHSATPTISGAFFISINMPDFSGFFGIQFFPLQTIFLSSRENAFVLIMSLSLSSIVATKERFPFSTTHVCICLILPRLIAIPTKIIITPRLRRKKPLGFTKKLNFPRIFLPNSVIRSRIEPKPIK